MLLDLFAFILPAYVANMIPVAFSGWGPLDLHRKIFGRRILGDHKTIRGTLSALLAGPLVAVLIGLRPFGPLSALLDARTGLLLSLGVVFGDLLGSFIKRQLSIKPGATLPGIDQLGFLIFALLFVSGEVTLSWEEWAILLLATPALHLGMNIVAYRLKMKEVPY